MKLFILKTNIKSQLEVNKLKPVFQKYNQIARWTVDLDDIDRVLKVETKVDSEQSDLINLVRKQGIYCEELPD
ncbi:hypothetical protein [Ekhidna sp. To15]|uniref:hypothetical protein n=1 Tax=Ekhidna sp. To15 TaxID=3395267 RepID=UPI003F5251E5